MATIMYTNRLHQVRLKVNVFMPAGFVPHVEGHAVVLGMVVRVDARTAVMSGLPETG